MWRAGCAECHSPHDSRGAIVEGKQFTGGFVMKGAGVRNVSTNLTPHPDSYLGKASRDEFVSRFKSFESIATAETASPVEPGQNTLMPWLSFAALTEQDLGAIYDYLKTLPPQPATPAPPP